MSRAVGPGALVVGVAGLLGWSGVAVGSSGFGPIAQNRQTVTAAVARDTATGAIDASDSLDEPFGFGGWSSSIESEAMLAAAGGPALVAGAMAWQDSFIGDLVMSGTGSVLAEVGDAGAVGELEAQGISAFSVFFAVSRATVVSFSAGISDGAGAFVRLEGPGGVLALLSEEAGPETAFAGEFVLGPGNYALNASAFGSLAVGPGGGPAVAGASWDFALVVVPGPGAAGLLAMGCVAGCVRRRRG